MERVSINELMQIERLLLEMNVRFKFDLSLGDSLKLYRYLKDVGEVTNFFFYIQDEYAQKNKDAEKLKEYNNKLVSEKIDFNIKEIQSFIDTVSSRFDDESFNDLLSKTRFWAN